MQGEISEGPEEEVLGGVFLRPAGSTAAAAQPKPAAINFKLTVTSPEVRTLWPLLPARLLFIDDSL